jgi:hypothetical protein
MVLTRLRIGYGARWPDRLGVHIRVVRSPTFADVHATRLIVDCAHALAPKLSVVVRTHSESDRDAFRGMGGVVQRVMGELELAVQMTRHALTRFGVGMLEAEAVAQGLRGRNGRPWAGTRSTFTRASERREPPTESPG